MSGGLVLDDQPIDLEFLAIRADAAHQIVDHHALGPAKHQEDQRLAVRIAKYAPDRQRRGIVLLLLGIGGIERCDDVFEAGIFFRNAAVQLSVLFIPWLPPFLADDAAAARGRRLLILTGVGVGSQFAFEFYNFAGRKPARPQQFAILGAAVDPENLILVNIFDVLADEGLDLVANPGVDVLARHIGHRHAEMHVTALFEDIAGKIALVHALHHHDHRAGLAVVEPARHGFRPPPHRALADILGLGLRSEEYTSE